MPSTSHLLLEALVERGIDYLFCNLGTDHAPLIEEMARWRRVRRQPPQMVLCPHENTAVHMAGARRCCTCAWRRIEGVLQATTA